MPISSAISRLSAFATTLALHLLVIAALLAGLRQANVIKAPHEVLVHFAFEKPKPVATPVAAAPLAPSVIDAAAPSPPVFTIAPGVAAGPVAPSGPMSLPSPPNADYGTSNAEPTWETALLGKLAGAKHFPDAARAAKQNGVVLLRFTMDRDGRVLSAGIEKSSGFAALDTEALAALQRAAPLPAPPAEVPGEVLDLIVPVDFF